jgi:predicted nucleotidyltransferase component of viral defense system
MDGSDQYRSGDRRLIEAGAVTDWGITHPWPAAEQIEQDLILSRAICEIAQDDYLGNELVFRGGTALNKLFFREALRYSEDLDYVRTSTGGISHLTSALTQIGEGIGFKVTTKIARHPKVYWKTTALNGLPIRIKIEMNTRERASALPIQKRNFSMNSKWWSGQACVQTYHPAELIATKLRALYQRSKGRDLFDIWMGMTELELEPDKILAAFSTYRPERYSSSLAIANLDDKLKTQTFRIDLQSLMSEAQLNYDIDEAAELVKETLLSKMDSL